MGKFSKLFLTFLLWSTALPVFSQITVSIHDKPLAEAIKILEKESDYSFFYSNQLPDLQTKVSIDAVNYSMSKILDKLLDKTQISYNIQSNKQITLNKKTAKQDNKSKGIAIEGTVTDEAGLPIVGVGVFVESQSSSGAATDVNGKYSLHVDNPNAMLIFSVLGYQTKNIAVNNRAVINVILKEDVQYLDEIVVLGYGTMKKSDLTGSVASLDPEDITYSSSGSIDKMLQGRISGLQVFNGGSDDNPQGNTTIRIRGASSINGSKSPLVVVDGVPIGDAGNLTSVNPNNIASIEVLKDASSTAIYGSRGANGVIMITTKSAESGSKSVFFSAKCGVGFFRGKLDYWRDPLQMAILQNEADMNDYKDPTYRGEKIGNSYFPSIEEIREGQWPYRTDWVKESFRAAVTQDYNVGVEAGTSKGRYYANIGYYSGKGMKKKDNYDKFSVDLNTSYKIYDNFNIKSQANFYKDFRTDPGWLAFNRNPLWPIYNGDGSYFKQEYTDYMDYNPVMNLENKNDRNETLAGNITISAELDILPSLKLVGTANGSAKVSEYSKYDLPDYTANGTTYNGVGYQSVYKEQKMLFDLYLTFDKIFGKHGVSAMIGGNFESFSGTSKSLEGRGFTSHILKEEALSGASVQLIDNSMSAYNSLSGFTRINYNYDNRYFFTFTARADGSSKFGKNNKWGFFPSGAVSWKISEEKFLKEVKRISLLKLRASYGISGNQGISPYQSIERYGYEDYYYNGQRFVIRGPGIRTSNQNTYWYAEFTGMGNSDLSWEKTRQFDIGIDMAFFDNRLDITMDYYYKRTSDLLREKYMAPSTGYTKVWVNDGDILNQGFEMNVRGRFDVGDFAFDLGWIFNLNRNKVLNIGSSKDAVGFNEVNGIKYQDYGSYIFGTNILNVLAIGYPMNSFFGYEVDGIIQSLPADIPDSDYRNHVGVNARPGEFNYVGMDPYSGLLDPGKRTIIGDPNPDFTTSLNIMVKHKIGLDLSVYMYAVYGNDVFTMGKYNRVDLKQYRWTPEHPSTIFPKLSNDRSNRLVPSSWFVEDGSFLRIQNITLGYTLPQKFIRSDNGNFRVYINVSNPFTFSKLKNYEYDPEFGENGLSGSAVYPRVCTTTIGLEVKF